MRRRRRCPPHLRGRRTSNRGIRVAHRYLLTGGGTGGHVTPAIALANELREREPDAEFLYVGIRNGKEAEIVPKYGYPLKFVHSHQWAFPHPLSPLVFLLQMGLGVAQSVLTLLRMRPHAVIGTGGYVAAPTVFANLILRKLGLSRARTIIHEQNITPGRLNSRIGNMADVVLVSFAGTRRYFRRAVYVGYPVRKEISPGDKAAAKDRLGIPQDTQLLFVFGGSMGARTVNRGIIDALPHLKGRPNLRVVHGRGRALTAYDPNADCSERLKLNKLAEDDLAGWYESYEFIDRMADYYAAADLVVGRGGAGTLSELCAAGRPSLLIPKANLPGDHQVMNAMELVHAGAAAIMFEDVEAVDGTTIESVDGKTLASRICDLLDDPARLDGMASTAAGLATPQSLTVTVDLIHHMLDGAKLDPEKDGLPLPKVPTGVFADLAHLSGEALRAKAERMVADLRQSISCSTPAERDAELVRLMADDEGFDYLRYRASVNLASPNWRVRNAGIKMVGILRHREKLPILLSILRDRTPAKWLHRLIGGDFQQNGFIRRNAMAALGQIGAYDEGVKQVLLLGLRDPYFEVRSQTCRVISRLGDRIGLDDDLEKALLVATDDRMFEVEIEAVRALGHVGRFSVVLPVMRKLHYDPNWKVRQAAVEGYTALVLRGEDVDVDEVRADLDRMVITSTGFMPSFSLKNKISQLGAALARKSDAREAEDAIQSGAALARKTDAREAEDAIQSGAALARKTDAREAEDAIQSGAAHARKTDAREAEDER